MVERGLLILAAAVGGVVCGYLGRTGTTRGRMAAYLVAFFVGWLTGRYWPH